MSAGSERRVHRRYPVSKTVRAASDTWRDTGTVRDISAGGAAIQIGPGLQQGDLIDLDIEGIGAVSGYVLRYEGDVAAVAFQADARREDDIADAIGRLHRVMGADEDA